MATTPERINQIAFQFMQCNKGMKYAGKTPVSEQEIRHFSAVVCDTIGVISEQEAYDFAVAMLKNL